MVKVPRLGRFRIPRRLTQRWRARLRAQRRWWRAWRRASAAGPVLFPPAGKGMIAIETLAGLPGSGSGPRIAILHTSTGGGHMRAAQALALALSRLNAAVTVREVD